MFIVLVFTLGCIIGNAESQCKDIVRSLSNHCGEKGDGGVCCDYKNLVPNEKKLRCLDPG